MGNSTYTIRLLKDFWPCLILKVWSECKNNPDAVWRDGQHLTKVVDRNNCERCRVKSFFLGGRRKGQMYAELKHELKGVPPLGTGIPPSLFSNGVGGRCPS